MTARLAALAVALALVAVAAAARAADSPVPSGRATVTYLAGGSVYVDAGREHGLRDGDTLRVERDGRTIASLRVAFLSSRRAACDTLAVTAAPRVGDVVFFTPAPAADAPAAADSATTTTPSAPAPEPVLAPAAHGGARTHGRAALRWLSVEGDGARFEQPELDLAFDARDLADGRLDLKADLRGRYTARSVLGARDEDLRARVYRLFAVAHDRGGRWKLGLGRQPAPAPGSAGPLDGVRVDHVAERWSAGVYGGAQPDPVASHPDGSVVEAGGYVGFRSASDEPPWSVIAGAASSRAGGETNRDYAFASGEARRGPASVFVAQELDWNHGWKRDLGEPAIELTSTLAHALLRLSAVTVRAGFDNRRNLRLLRDRLTPEAEFDERHRTGGWLGLAWTPRAPFRGSADARAHGGAGVEGRSGSATLELLRLLGRDASVRLRGAAYRGGDVETDLASVAAALRLSPGLRVELGGGARHTRTLGLELRQRWESVALDLDLARGVYLSASWERRHGDDEEVVEHHAGAGYRF